MRVASEGQGPYDRMIQFALLTATRLNESAQMKRTELSIDGLDWTIPAARYKTKIDHLIPLSPSRVRSSTAFPSSATLSSPPTAKSRSAASPTSRRRSTRGWPQLSRPKAMPCAIASSRI